MADVEVQMQYTTTEKKTRRVKKTSSKRRESDGNQIESEVTISELDNGQGYVLVASSASRSRPSCPGAALGSPPVDDVP